ASAASRSVVISSYQKKGFGAFGIVCLLTGGGFDRRTIHTRTRLRTEIRQSREKMPDVRKSHALLPPRRQEKHDCDNHIFIQPLQWLGRKLTN
ncbi:hypothetical protein, partial [Mesorhizobium sp.]|uniref:hypothetical protein n=1 Tax=Mesorhizobium sp. TaxID=1871066 RepID=UPI0025F3049E